MTGNREDHFANQKMYATLIAVIMADVSRHLNYTELNAFCSRMHQVCFFVMGDHWFVAPRQISKSWVKEVPYVTPPECQGVPVRF